MSEEREEMIGAQLRPVGELLVLIDGIVDEYLRIGLFDGQDALSSLSEAAEWIRTHQETPGWRDIGTAPNRAADPPRKPELGWRHGGRMARRGHQARPLGGLGKRPDALDGAADPSLTPYQPGDDVMGEKQTMTLNLSPAEMAVVEKMAEQQELSKTALIRQALRWYETTVHRIRQGETVTFSGDRERIAMFIGPGFAKDPDQ